MLRPVVASILFGTSTACTSIAVGKDASATGYPIITHSDDSGPNTVDTRWIRVPSKTWPEGSQRPLHFYVPGYPRVVVAERAPDYAPVDDQTDTEPIGHIPQVRETFGYWDTNYGVQNEKGLSIGESTCTARTVGWPAGPGRPHGYNRAGIEDLTKIAMERCATARCAVQLMGDVAVQMGFYSADGGTPENPIYAGSSECLNVADGAPGDVWVFNVMTGRNNASAIWAAKRIPSDHIAPIGNAFTIRKMRLDDPDNILYSPDVTALAVENGWWSPQDEESFDTPQNEMSFDFFGAYGLTPTADAKPANLATILQFYSGRRMWRVWNLLTPEEGRKLDPHTGHLPHTEHPYPTSLRAPRNSVTVKMVMDVHRDHYEGTPFDLTKGMAAGPHGSPNRYAADPSVVGQWERAISMYRTSWSHIVEAKPDGRGISWLGLDAAHGTAYLPFYAGATDRAPEAWRSGKMSSFNMSTAWWAFQLVNQYSDLNFELINAEVRRKADAVELEAIQNIGEWEAQTVGMNQTNASEFLTSKTHAYAEAKLEEWWQLAWHIFSKYGRYVVTHNESDDNARVASSEDGTAQAYPAWWLNSPEVGFTTNGSNGAYTGVLDQPVAGSAHEAEDDDYDSEDEQDDVSDAEESMIKSEVREQLERQENGKGEIASSWLDSLQREEGKSGHNHEEHKKHGKKHGKGGKGGNDDDDDEEADSDEKGKKHGKKHGKGKGGKGGNDDDDDDDDEDADSDEELLAVADEPVPAWVITAIAGFVTLTVSVGISHEIGVRRGLRKATSGNHYVAYP